jgi:8-oxo-dGTP diphosphatase
MTPRDTARGIVVHDDQILLMERWRDNLHYFSIPGGGIEPGETPEQTVIREITEETSILADVKRQIILMEDQASKHYIFVCEYQKGEPVLPLDAPERAHGDDNRFLPHWVPISSLADLSFGHWESLKPIIIAGLKTGFPDGIKVV